MNTNGPSEGLHLGRTLRRLTPAGLESSLLGCAPFTKKDRGWRPEVLSKGILVDLSRVEWVDIGAAAQLVAFLEGALRSGIQIAVALPLTSPTPGEMRAIDRFRGREREEIFKRVEARRYALSFLTHLGLQRALRPKHLELGGHQVKILRNYDPRHPELPFAGKEQRVETEDPTRERRYKMTFPLTWVTSGDNSTIEQLVRFLFQVIGSPKRGLEQVDALALSNVFLHEMVENVIAHACPAKAALVTAFARPSNIPPVSKDYLGIEAGYLNWTRSKNTPMIEMVVADSGCGVDGSLRASYAEQFGKKALVKNEADVLRWAFDRWSSRLGKQGRRGTRGLYRVDRVASKYDGLITLRAGSYAVVADHGGAGFDKKIISRQRLAHVPGTCMRVRLPPFRPRRPQRVLRVASDSSIQYVFVNISSSGSKGLPEKAIDSLRGSLQKSKKEEPTAVVVVISSLKAVAYESVEATLRQAVHLRHPPGLVVVGLQGGWDLVEQAIDSVNAEGAAADRAEEAKKQERTLIWDPVLVVGPEGQVGWVGAWGGQLDLLRRLSIAPKSTVDISDLESEFGGDAIQEMYKRARVDPQLITETNDSFQLLVRLPTILGAAQASFCAVVDAELDGSDSKCLLTPSLAVARAWLDVYSLVERSVGARLVALALANLIRAEIEESEEPPLMLTDHDVEHPFVDLLCEALGIVGRESVSAGFSVGHASRLIARGARVIVYSDVLSTGESAGTCIAQVLRNLAEPVCVATLIDGRPDRGGTYHVWGTEVPVVAVAKADLLVDFKGPLESLPQRNPVSGEIENLPRDFEDFNYHITPEKLTELVSTNRALSFGHVGRRLSRHFTFYLNVKRLLKESAVVGAFDGIIADWFESRVSDKDLPIEVWYPLQESSLPTATEYLVRGLQVAKRPGVRISGVHRISTGGNWTFPAHIDARRREFNLLLVDWGAFSGTTLLALLRRGAMAGARQILVCVFLSHLSNDTEAFFRQLSSLEGADLPPDEDQQMSIPGLPTVEPDNRSSRVGRREVDVRVEFISSFAIQAYDGEGRCPVCEQVTRLANEQFPSRLLERFGRYQEQGRLALRPRSWATTQGPVDLDGRHLTAESIRWMLNFRALLQKAQGSTSARLLIKEMLAGILSGYHSRGESVIWLLSFLSVEVQWFRRPPLDQRSMRHDLALISLAAATDRTRDARDRMTATIVLRTASKKIFSENFTRLLLAPRSTLRLQAQVLYAAFTFISRPYLSNPVAFEELQRQIDESVGAIEISSSASGEVLRTLRRLANRILYKTARAQSRRLSSLSAWSRLQSLFCSKYTYHSILPDRFFDEVMPGHFADSIRDAIENRRRLSVNERSFVRLLAKSWIEVCSYLEEHVLPCLRVIEKILGTGEYQASLRTSGFMFITWLLDRHDPLVEWRVSKQLELCAEEPDRIREGRWWNYFTDQVDMMWRVLIRPPSDEGRPSRIIQVLGTIPIDSGSILRDVLSRSKEKWPNCEIRVEDCSGMRQVVFCSEDVLRYSLRTVLDNCEDHRSDSCERVMVGIGISGDKAHLLIRVRSIGTDPEARKALGSSRGHRVGLKTAEKRLRPYGGQLQTEELRDPKGFVVDLGLERWGTR